MCVALSEAVIVAIVLQSMWLSVLLSVLQVLSKHTQQGSLS